MRSTIIAVILVVVSLRVARGESDVDPEAAMYACGKPKGTFTISFKPELELRELAAWAMGFSCKRILYGSSLASRSAKVTMLTPGALSAAEAWHVFQAALHTMGLAAVKKGEVLEIVESAMARDEALAIVKQFPDGGAEVVRLLLRPEHVEVDDLKLALELVKSKHGEVAALPRLRALLVTDDAAHVARMATLVRDLDRPAAGDGVYAIPLEHVDAATVVDTLKKLIGDAGTGNSTAPAFVAVPRVNAVFVVGSAAEYLRSRAVARAIDVDLGDAARIHSIRLRHASAKDLAATLGILVGGAASAPATATRGAATGADDALTGPVRFAADEASNTLLVLAAPRDAVAVRALIDDLDVRRRQVYVEALVLEVESSNTRDVGISAHGGRTRSDGSRATVGAFQSEGLSSIDPKTALGSGGLISGVLGAPLQGMLGDLLGTTVPSFGLLIRLAAHESRLEVLASPHVMTVDNKPSTISVGVDIPYKATQSVTTGTFQSNPNIDRKKVGLTLAITPHVAPAEPGTTGDTVTLEVKLESGLVGKEDFGGMGPTWKDRSIITTVILRDQESIVLGGVVDERVEETADKIPVLGDIPLLGRLFRSTHKVRLKSNLLVVLTPHLVDDSLAGRAILDRRMRERDEFITGALALERRVLTPGIDYRTRRGLIADINEVVMQVEADTRALAAARATLAIPAGRVDEPYSVPNPPDTGHP